MKEIESSRGLCLPGALMTLVTELTRRMRRSSVGGQFDRPPLTEPDVRIARIRLLQAIRQSVGTAHCRRQRALGSGKRFRYNPKARHVQRRR